MENLYEDAESVDSSEFVIQPLGNPVNPVIPLPIPIPEQYPYNSDHPLFELFKANYQSSKKLEDSSRQCPNMKLVSLKENKVLESTPQAGSPNTVPMYCIDKKIALSDYIRRICAALATSASTFITNNLLGPIQGFQSRVTTIAAKITHYREFIVGQRGQWQATFATARNKLRQVCDQALANFNKQYEEIRTNILQPILDGMPNVTDLNVQYRSLFDNVISTHGGEGFSITKFIEDKKHQLETLNPEALDQGAQAQMNNLNVGQVADVQNLEPIIANVSNSLEELRKILNP